MPSIPLPLLLLLLISIISATANDTTPCQKTPPMTCPVRCFRPDPVCAEDGTTYWCGCPDAMCAGKRVAKLGFCEVGNGGEGLLMGQALLLVHIVWMVVLGFSVLCGFL